MKFQTNLLALILCCLFAESWTYHSSHTSTNQVRVGAFFERQYDAISLAFQHAMTEVKLHTDSSSVPIDYDMELLTPGDSFDAQNKSCFQMKSRNGIASVFGGVSQTSQSHLKLLCNFSQIPYIETSWIASDSRSTFAINLYPDNEELSKAFADILKFWNWKIFTVIYEDGNGLIRLQKVLEIPGGNEYKMTIRQLEVSQNNNEEEMEQMLADMKEKKEYRVIIDCHVSKIPQFLEKADSMGMLSGYYHFHFTTLDLTQIDIEPYLYKGANITSMRLLDPANRELNSLTSDWVNQEVSYGRSPLLGARFIGTEPALMYDAVYMFAHAVRKLSRAGRPVITESLKCHKKEKWENGTSLLNYLHTSVHHGLSGEIRLVDGRRKDFRLSIISITIHGLNEIGSWDTKTGINITSSSEIQKVQDDKERLRNTTLRVVTIYDPPYVMKLSEPNERGQMHEGFIIDLLDELSDILGFNYTIYEQEDRQYGSEIAPGKWNGMIGDLMARDSRKKADIAAAGLSITYSRARVVDFSMPFLNLGITIIYKKPVISPPDLFSFLLPLSPDVWIYMIAAYLCVSFIMFIIARFSPYEWENPHPCNNESEEVENVFSILNCLWFAIGSLMQQGSDIAPKASSTRLVASIWYLFTLIIVSSYTANLAAFLTKSRMDAPIKNADDLSLQSEIKYGTLNSGSTRDFFKNAKMDVYKRMNSFMTANQDVFVSSNRDGFEKVKASQNYAFLSESTSIDYQVQRNCDLMQVGDLLDSKGYGLAAPKDSPWIKYISKEIVHLQQQQILAKKYKKWWVDKSDTVCEEDNADDQQTSALGVGNLGGVFLVLAGGSIFALFVSVLEFLWKARKTSRKENVSFLTEVKNELFFIFLKCTSSRNKGDEDSVQDEKEVNRNDVQVVSNLNKDTFV